MENRNEEVIQMPGNNETSSVKSDILSHALGLQDLYVAAFSTETAGNTSNFPDNKALTGNIDALKSDNEKFFSESHRIKAESGSTNTINKTTSLDESYHLYSLKGLEYSVAFVKPNDDLSDLAPLKLDEEKLESNEVLSSLPYDTLQTNANPVVDLDKEINVHLVKPDDTAADSNISTPGGLPLLNYECSEYTGDAQILHRYLCDSVNVLCESGNIVSSPVMQTVTLNFLDKETSVPKNKTGDNDSVGVNPETLGIRFEDCEFNSSDSFASTESIIPKNVKCPKCPKKFMFKSDLLRHDKYKHSIKPKLFCKYCKKEFASQQNLLFHEKSHKKKKKSLFKCDMCKMTFSKATLLAKHMSANHVDSDIFTCSHCNKVLITHTMLINHCKNVHGVEVEKPFKCDTCSKSFEKKQSLICHSKSHSEEQPYICQYCGKFFSRIRYLKNHQKSHLEDQKNIKDDKDGFFCDICAKDCKTPGALEEHLRKHTGEKPFTCSVCMKSFAYKAYFKVHIKKHGELSALICCQCSKTFATPADLAKHEKCHGNEGGEPSGPAAHRKRQSSANRLQEVCTQTTAADFTMAPDAIRPAAAQSLNLIVDPSFVGQHPILLTSIGNLIASNSMPVILTQNPGGSYSVIT